MSVDIRTGPFATDGIHNEPPSERLKESGWHAGDVADLGVTSWLHREAARAQGSAAAMNLCDAMSRSVDLPADLWSGTPSNIEIYTAAYDPVGNYHLFSVYESSPGDRWIALSGDGMLTSTFVNTSLAAGAAIDTLAIVPGEWAFAMVTGSDWYSSASPYTSWTHVTTSTFTAANMGRGRCVCTLEGAEQLAIVGHNGGTAYLAYTSTATRPTTAGAWTELTPATLSEANGIATNGERNVIAGAIGGATPTIAYADVADGGISGDWSTVTVGTGSCVDDVVYDGTKFVAVDANGDSHHSYDGATWTQGTPAGLGGAWWAMESDPITGLVVCYPPSSIAPYIYASRDGIVFHEVTADSGLDIVFGSGRWGFDSRLGRLFAGDGAALDTIKATS